jgi:glucose-1-phosphate cytidylyltransferase
MKYYSNYGYKDFVLCLGYQGQVIKDYLLNNDAYTGDCTVMFDADNSIEFHTNNEESNWRVKLADTDLETMTGERIRKIRHYVGDDENFLLTYDDKLRNIDLDALLAFHKSQSRILNMTGVCPPGRFGELMTDAEGLATGLNEMPQASGGLISGGFFVCRREVFDYLDDRNDLVFEQEPIQVLVRDRQLPVYEIYDFWQCMDTNCYWQLLNTLMEKGRRHG